MHQDTAPKFDPKENTFRIFMLFPLLLFVAAYMLDKQLFIWHFPEYFLRTASFVSYEQKHDMQIELQRYLTTPQHKKVVVMFGNSRTTTFDNQYIKEKFPKYILYNFSVPGGTADYYLYRLLKFEKSNIKPDYIYFAVSPQGLNASPAIAMDEVMLEGLSASFVLRHFNQYKVSYLTNFLAKKLFWTYQYRPKLDVILKRMRNDSRQRRDFRNFLAGEMIELNKNRGSVFVSHANTPPKDLRDADYLRKSAEGTWRDFLTPFSVDPGQLKFMQQTLEVAQRMKIPNALLWVKVGPNLRRLKANKNIAAQGQPFQSLKGFFVPLMNQYAKQYHSTFLDMNYGNSIRCDLFNDSSHMASYCFAEMTDYLFSRLP